MDYGPIRAIEGDVVLSPTLPRLGIRFSSDFIYLGDLQFLSGETFHVEEFIFICPNGLGHVTRLLLLHFAGYLDNKVGAYDYSPSRTISLDGEEYQYEICFVDINDFLDQIPSPELAHAADYIRQRAYTLAGDMVYQRFTRLVSADRRNEFTVAYLERVEATEKAGSLLDDPATLQALLDRALSNFTIIR